MSLLKIRRFLARSGNYHQNYSLLPVGHPKNDSVSLKVTLGHFSKIGTLLITANSNKIINPIIDLHSTEVFCVKTCASIRPIFLIHSGASWNFAAQDCLSVLARLFSENFFVLGVRVSAWEFFWHKIRKLGLFFMTDRNAYSWQDIKNLELAGVSSAIKFFHGRVLWIFLKCHLRKF